jgi:hypothetical protein
MSTFTMQVIAMGLVVMALAYTVWQMHKNSSN